MAIWEAATLDRFSQEAEDIFAREFPCIISRTALAIVDGTHTYTLSDSIIDIRKITWKGKKLAPLTNRTYRSFNLSSSGVPTEYIFDNVGQSKIHFFPTPSENISSTASNLFGSEIPNRVIVEHYRTPDYTTYVIPTFFRRRLLKAYVLKQCFAIEGKGKNLKAAAYWSKKWDFLKEMYGELLASVINQPRRLIVGQDFNSQFDARLGTKNLSSSFGIGVDDES